MRLLSVYAHSERQGEWPSVFLETDDGVYETTPSAVRKSAFASPPGENMTPALSAEEISRIVGEITTVIVILRSGVTIVIEPVYDPSSDASWPTVDVQTAKQAEEWCSELTSMETLWP